MTITRTPSQTVGPFFSIGLCRRRGNVLDENGVELSGRLLDGAGAPVPDGLVEIWDAEHRAFGRCGTDADGRFSFRVAAGARTVDVHVFARGLLRHLTTRFDLSEENHDVHLQGEDETVFYAS